MKAKVIVTREDADIDCDLFRQMQVFLVQQMKQPGKEAADLARSFMRNFWLNRDEGRPIVEIDKRALS